MQPAHTAQEQPLRGIRRVSLPPLSLEHIWSLVAVVTLFLALRTFAIRPHDFWWHIAVGREIVATGHIPTLDTYSYTAHGTAYPYGAYWFMECALYLLYSWGGVALVLFCQRAALAGAYYLIFLLCRGISHRSPVAAACWLFAVVIGLPNINVRPQLIAFPLSALFLWAIYAYRRSSSRYLLAVFPIGMALWVNSHGSFVMGFLLLMIWLGDETWRYLQSLRSGHAETRRLWAPLVALASAGLASLLNPSGMGILRYVTDLAGNSIIQQRVPEWAAPSFGSIADIPFLLGLLFSAAVLAMSPRRPDTLQMLTYLGLGLMSLKTARATLWFGMAMAPVMADHLPLVLASARAEADAWLRWFGRRRVPPMFEVEPRPKATAAAIRRAPLVLNYTVAALLAAGTVVAQPWVNGILPVDKRAPMISDETPVRATAFLLQARPPGRLFHYQAYGSYLIWAAQPDYPVFVDPRIDLYPADIWNDYLAVERVSTGWEQVLARYGVRTLMLDLKQESALVRAARESPNWQLIYEDARTVIFTIQP